MLNPSPDRTPGARLAFLVLLCVAALGLAACGGDDDDTTTTTTPTGATGVEGEAEEGEAEDGAATEEDVGALRERFEKALRENLIQTQGLTESQADCAIDKLRDTVTDEQIQQVIAGEQPQAVQEAAFDAGEECANE